MLAHDFFLEFHQAVEESLGAGRATGNINIDRDEVINALQNGVATIHAAGRRAGTHGDAPFRLRHLIPDPLHGERHFVSDGSCHDHHIALARRKSHHLGAETRDVVARRRSRHQLDGAASEPHRHWPERVAPHPIDRGVHLREDNVPLNFRVVGYRALVRHRGGEGISCFARGKRKSGESVFGTIFHAGYRLPISQ